MKVIDVKKKHSHCSLLADVFSIRPSLKRSVLYDTLIIVMSCESDYVVLICLNETNGIYFYSKLTQFSISDKDLINFTFNRGMYHSIKRL